MKWHKHNHFRSLQLLYLYDIYKNIVLHYDILSKYIRNMKDKN